MTEELPPGVRKVPGPEVRWQIRLGPDSFDGYVFADDPSDLAKFVRWAANRFAQQGTITLYKVTYP